MRSSIYVAGIAFLLCGLIACKTSPCHEEGHRQGTPQNVAEVEATQLVDKAAEHVMVYKPDGSFMCGQGQVVPLADMAGQLKDVRVYSSVSKMDRLMHMQMCGKPTGRSNVFEIHRDDLDKARAEGFREWIWD